MKRGRKPIYPWDYWINSPRFTATRGIDFHVAPASFVNMLRQRAVYRNVGLRVRVIGDAVDVLVKRRSVVDPFEDVA